MSKERELLLKILVSEQLDIVLSRKVGELLSQPEQTLTGDKMIEMWRDGYDAGTRLDQPEQTKPDIGLYVDIFEDYKYLITAFENGADANDYSRELQQAKSNIRKARNWIHPLPTDVIDELTLKSFYAGTFDFRVFARELEKQHGIGFTDE